MSGSRDTDDEAWRSIVENYGERAQVDDVDVPVVEEPVVVQPEPFAPTYDELDASLADEHRFVPPDPGPGPRMQLPRDLPWLGVIGIPAFLLLATLLSLDLPSWIGYLLVLGFVGSFVYLVMTMRRGGRDPWDDGAQV